MWGIIPAAGRGSRIQPLAFSKELLPVGARSHGGERRPRAVSDYLVERMVRGGVTRLCFVISPAKSDILQYYGGEAYETPICYCVQPQPLGLCDAVFRALSLVDGDEPVVIGLPDTVWFPVDGLRALPRDALSFLLFPVEHPEFFDAVLTRPDGRVESIQVKQAAPSTRWIWGAIQMPATVFRSLYALWRGRGDEYIGTLVNAWLAAGGEAWGVRAGTSYLDVGAMEGWFEAVRALAEPAATSPSGSLA